MIVLHLFKHFCACGIALLGFFAVRKLQLFKKNVSQLLGGFDVEFLPCQFKNILFQRSDLCIKALSEFVQIRPVAKYAGALHGCQNLHQRKFALIKNSFEAVGLQFLFLLFPESLAKHGFFDIVVDVRPHFTEHRKLV